VQDSNSNILIVQSFWCSVIRCCMENYLYFFFIRKRIY